jgi:uncharacterized protein YukE
MKKLSILATSLLIAGNACGMDINGDAPPSPRTQLLWKDFNKRNNNPHSSSTPYNYFHSFRTLENHDSTQQETTIIGALDTAFSKAFSKDGNSKEYKTVLDQILANYNPKTRDDAFRELLENPKSKKDLIEKAIQQKESCLETIKVNAAAQTQRLVRLIGQNTDGSRSYEKEQSQMTQALENLCAQYIEITWELNTLKQARIPEYWVNK